MVLTVRTSAGLETWLGASSSWFCWLTMFVIWTLKVFAAILKGVIEMIIFVFSLLISNYLNYHMKECVTFLLALQVQYTYL